VLAQSVAHRAQRRLGDRLNCTPGPAVFVPGARRGPLLRRIGVSRPRRPDLGRVPRTVRLAADPIGLLGPADGGLAYPELAGKLAITGRAHPYTGLEGKS
jgi:hypothetical protein